MSKLDEYANKYRNMAMEREDGVLKVSLHTNGGPFIFSGRAHRELGDAFVDIARDPDNKVIIIDRNRRVLLRFAGCTGDPRQDNSGYLDDHLC